MKKLVRTNLTNSPTRRGTENLNIQFYSHDKNNAGFEFVIKNETDISHYTAKVLFKFRDSNSTWQANGTIEGNVVKVSFNTDLIARCEEVLGFLFLDSDSDSLDVFKFKFNVILSEIDKNEVEERKIKHVENISSFELVTRAELKEELSKLQINGVDLSDYLTTKVANETYALKNEIPSINGFATTSDITEAKKSVVEEIKKLGYVKATDIPAAYNDSELSKRVTNLENKADKDTVYDDSDLKNRVQVLENRPAGTSYDDSKLVERVKKLEDKPGIDTSKFITEDTLTAKKIVTKDELNTLKPNQTLSLNNNTLSISGGNSVTLPTNQYEIHGTGMPNGVVTAEIGTTYVDKNKTNGALKWIKTTDGGNTGWEVLIGDTGWRTLNSVSRAGNSFIKIRRVNNLVTYQFGGLQWGWFGVGKRNGPGFVRHNSSGDKGAKLTYPNGIPEGFRSENSLVGPTYDDKGRPYGIWYLGGKSDLNFIQFTFNDPIPTDRDIGDIRVSAISYLTEETWPTQLP
ncbi:hypothetical protein PNO24_00560 [Gemella haemolysans]|uniref:BppU family phage baseplate upper protein n=1 Tax=Gemella haemolysans TaxID=1379 RepID=UPI00232D5543|nr:BppU family phage baseplate upper protein [Gemella haemolysans]MDB6212418.1 hypothetical protein [Gemella haemolysans]